MWTIHLSVLNGVIEEDPSFLLQVGYLWKEVTLAKAEQDRVLLGIALSAIRLLYHPDLEIRDYALTFLNIILEKKSSSDFVISDLNINQMKVTFLELKSWKETALESPPIQRLNESTSSVMHLLQKHMPVMRRLGEVVLRSVLNDDFLRLIFDPYIFLDVKNPEANNAVISYEQAVENFLKTEDQRVLLISGPPGSGKTKAIFQKTWQNLKSYNPDDPEEYLFIIVSLSQLQNPFKSAINETLNKIGFDNNDIDSIRDKRILFIFEDYDKVPFEENNGQIEFRNLYSTNGCEQWPNSKFMFTLRTDFCPDTFFQPNGGALVHYEIIGCNQAALINHTKKSTPVGAGTSTLTPVEKTFHALDFAMRTAISFPAFALDMMPLLPLIEQGSPSPKSPKFNHLSFAVPNLKKVMALFGLQMTSFNSLDEITQACFDAVCGACLNQEWQKVEAAGEGLIGLYNLLGKSPFVVFLEQGNKHTIQSILARKLETILSSNIYTYPLHGAILEDRKDFLALLASLVPVDQTDSKGKTAIFCAIETGKDWAVEILKKHRASLKVVYRLEIKPFSENNFVEFPPLAWAVARGEQRCFDILASDAWVQDTVIGIGNLLHVGVHFGQSSMLKHLFKTYPARVQLLLFQKDSEGRTPALLAVSLGNLEVLLILMEQGADLEDKNRLGQTVAGIAALCGHRTMVKLFISLNRSREIAGSNTQPSNDLIKDQKIQEMLQKKESYKSPKVSYFVHPHNIVFVGDNPEFMLGVWQQCEEQKKSKKVKRLCGYEYGAFIAPLAALGYKAKEIEILLPGFQSLISTENIDLEFNSLHQHEMIIRQIWRATGLLDKQQQTEVNRLSFFEYLYQQIGKREGEELRLFFEKRITEKTGIPNCTFGELAELISQGKPFKHLYLYGQRVGRSSTTVCFNSEDSQWNDLIISDAISIAWARPELRMKSHFLHYKIMGERLCQSQRGTFVCAFLSGDAVLEHFDAVKYMANIDTDEGNFMTYNYRTLGVLGTQYYISAHNVRRIIPWQGTNVEAVSSGQQAFKNYYKEAQLKPSFSTAKKVGDENIGVLLEHPLIVQNDGEGILLYLLGMKKLQMRDYQSAMHYFDQAREILNHPDSAKLLDLANAYYDLGLKLLAEKKDQDIRKVFGIAVEMWKQLNLQEDPEYKNKILVAVEYLNRESGRKLPDST